MSLSKILFIPDSHIPYHNKKAFKLLLKAAKSFKPDIVVILGDFCDFYSVSRFSKDPKRKLNLKWEIEEVNKELNNLDSLGATKKIFISGNHEFRLERFIFDKAPELDGLFNIESCFKLKERGWVYVPYRRDIKLGKVYLTHDVNHTGRMAGHKVIDTYMHSAITAHCFDEDTELLTPNGWINGNSIKENDTVATYNLNSNTTEWQQIQTKYEYNNYDKLVSIEGAATNLRVTEDHGMVCYKPITNNLWLPKAKELLDQHGFQIPCAGILDREEYLVSDNELKLVIWVATDGSFTDTQVRFNFKKERKITTLKTLLEEMKIPYTHNNNYSRIAFQKSILNGLMNLQIKKLPNWVRLLNCRQAKILLDTYSITDGCKNLDAQNSYQICSYKNDELNLLQETFCLAGFRTTKNKNYLTVNTKSWTSLKKQNVGIEPYKGTVWCVSVPNGTLQIRHNGQTAITQNTHRMIYIVEADGVGEPVLSAQWGWLGDVEKIDYQHRITAVKNYVLGFGIGYLEKSTGYVFCSPVPIIHNRCMINGEIFSV